MAFHRSPCCEACAQLVGLIQQIDREASAQTAVPEHLVRAAKAVFPGASRNRQPAGLALVASHPETSGLPHRRGPGRGRSPRGAAVHHAGPVPIGELRDRPAN